MEYNDFEIIKPDTFDEIAKAYSFAKNKEQAINIENVKTYTTTLESLKNSYAFLSKRGINIKRKNFFKKLENASKEQISSLTKNSYVEKEGQIIFPLTCKSLIKAELSLVKSILKSTPAKIDNEVIELITSRISIIEKLISIQK